MISKLDRSCNWDNKNRPAIATRINSLSSLLLEKIGFPTKQRFADNLRHLPLPSLHLARGGVKCIPRINHYSGPGPDVIVGHFEHMNSTNRPSLILVAG